LSLSNIYLSLYLELNHKSENPDQSETDAKQTQIEDEFLTMKKKLKDLTLRVEQLEAILNERFSSG